MISTKIIYFDWHSGASELYRLAPLDYIENKQISITRSTERQISSNLLNQYHVVIICRPSSEIHLNIIKMAKDMGKKIILDFDDNTLCVPEINPAHLEYGPNKQNTIKCLSYADEIWVTTLAIKHSFKKYNSSIHVIPNCHNDRLFPIDKKMPFGEKKVVMWRGGLSHIGDIYYPGVTEWIVELINKNKDWHFYWLGQRFEWIELRIKHGNLFHNQGGSNVQFYKMMHEMNAKCFFYPLVNDIFNLGKSNCSWIEASYSGSAYFGNNDMPEFNKPGISPLLNLDYALNGNHDDELREMNKLSWEFICDELILSKVNKQREQRLIEIGR